MLIELGRFQNLYLMGRGGMFWYNNMDNCIKAGIEFVRWLNSFEEHPSTEKKTEWILNARKNY